MSAAALTSLERFLALPDDETVIRELDDGRILELPPPQYVHGLVAPNLVHELKKALAGGELRVVQGPGFRLSEQTMRIPDVFVIRKDVGESMGLFHGWYEATPELAIEVVSPGERAWDLDRKLQQFLKAGVKVVWAVYPETRHVVAQRNDGSISDFKSGDRVTEPGVLGDSTIAVDDLFDGIASQD